MQTAESGHQGLVIYEVYCQTDNESQPVTHSQQLAGPSSTLEERAG